MESEKPHTPEWVNEHPLESKLLQLRDLTRRFGTLDPLQEAQLRLWPFAVDPELDNNVADIDFDTYTVYYKWVRPKKKLDKNYGKRLLELEDQIRFLLGANWKLQILCNGQTIFTSGKDVGKPEPKPAKTVRSRNSQRRKPARNNRARRKR